MSLGINMIYDPVFDVHLPRDGYMNLRAYGSKMAAVVKLGTATLKGYLPRGSRKICGNCRG